MKPTLLVLAAGMGSRYGGLKQIDPIGPNGEIIMDYSMYDAINAGFKKVVFVIRQSFEDIFREKIADKLKGNIDVEFAFQELGNNLDGFKIPEGREKPWGTGHAILVAKDLIDGPFAVINADDYYGQNSYKLICNHLMNESEYAMVGFPLKNTLSEHGHVSRGVCQCDESLHLQHVTEITKITKTSTGAQYTDANSKTQVLTGDEIVSMNLWGFENDIFGYLSEQFKEFLETQGNELKSEFYIPFAVDRLIREGEKKVKVLQTQDSWFGVTYKEDKPAVEQSIAELVEQGVYPKKLW